MEAFDYHITGNTHNFGVFKNSGKKVILQIDFKSNRINLIKRGVVQYKCEFDELSYDSEEGVMINIKIGAKQLEVAAESLEEKTAICRLLSIVQCNTDELVTRAASTETTPTDNENVVVTRPSSVLKEGILEKKGNATIQLWAKRRVKVTPGMVSYFKTDEQTALNVVPLKPNQYHVKRIGQNAFNVVFSKRTYHFRLVHNNDVQQEREEWVKAFESACLEKRRTVVNFENTSIESLQQPDTPFKLNVRPFSQRDHLSEDDDDERLEIDAATQTPTNENKEQNEEERLSLLVPKTEALECATKDRAKKKPSQRKKKFENTNPSITEEHEDSQSISIDESANNDCNSPHHMTPCLNTEIDEELKRRLLTQENEKNEYESVNENVVTSEKNSTENNDTKEDDSYDDTGVVDAQTRMKLYTETSEGLYDDIPDDESKSAKSHNDHTLIHTETEGTTESKFKEETDLESPYSEFADYADIERSDPNKCDGNVDNSECEEAVFRDIVIEEKGDSVKKSEEIVYAKSMKRRRKSNQLRESLPPPPPPPIPPDEEPSRVPTPPPIYNPEPSDDLPKLTTDSPLSDSSTQSSTPSLSSKEITRHSKLTPPPPPPSVPPPPPPQNIPPPPPTTSPSAKKSTNGKGSKLRTLHWMKLQKPQMKGSFWKEAKDRTSSLNVELIKTHFSINGNNNQNKQEQSFATSKLLLDPTRARNLGIILTGLRSEGACNIRDVLNSVQEVENFPPEKLTTIRRYQPTSDDVELFKLYSDRREILDPVDRFMLELCEIDCIGIRLDFILLLWDFPRQLKCTSETVEELTQACAELKNNKELLHLMEYILAVGNHMNAHVKGSKASGFRISSLRMFMDMRGKTTDYTFSHFLVEQLMNNDPDVISWTNSIVSVTKCKDISTKAVLTETEVLRSDLTKLKKNLKALKSKLKKPTEMDTTFLTHAQMQLVDFESNMNALDNKNTHMQTTYRHLLDYYGEIHGLASNEFFSVIAEFGHKFKQAKEDIDRKRRFQAAQMK